MKNLILLSAFFMLSTNYAKAQSTFTIPELEKLSTSNSSDFETYILKKGYSYQSSLSDLKNKLYWYDGKRPNGRIDQIVRAVDSTVVFTTTSKQYYLDIKSALVNNGYEYFFEKNKDVLDMPTTWYYYANKKFISIIYSYTTSDGIATYQIHVFKSTHSY